MLGTFVPAKSKNSNPWGGSRRRSTSSSPGRNMKVQGDGEDMDRWKMLCNLPAGSLRELTWTNGLPGEGIHDLAGKPFLFGVQHLSLVGNDLGSVDCAPLEWLLKQQRSALTTLDIHDNRILASGLEVLGRGLTHAACKLQYLDIGYNEIAHPGGFLLAKILADAHYNGSVLQALSIAGNPIGTNGIVSMMKVLEKAGRGGLLSQLDLTECNLGTIAIPHLHQLCAARSDLVIHFTGNAVDNSSASGKGGIKITKSLRNLMKDGQLIMS